MKLTYKTLWRNFPRIAIRATFLLGTLIVVKCILGNFFNFQSKEVNKQIHESIDTSNITTAFIVRAHKDYGSLLLSLLWSLHGQRRYEGGILFLVVPTEYDQESTLEILINKFFPNDFSTKVHVKVLNIEKERYELYSTLLSSLCTKEWKELEISQGFPEDHLERVCTVNSPLHYHITDIALEYTLQSCLSCNYIVITNADNTYSPNFLFSTISLLNQYDIVITDMLHMDTYVHAAPRLSQMDLGGVIFQSKYLKSAGYTFVTALPQPPEPHHYHDADYFFIKKLMGLGAHISVLHKVLFVHN